MPCVLNVKLQCPWHIHFDMKTTLRHWYSLYSTPSSSKWKLRNLKWRRQPPFSRSVKNHLFRQSSADVVRTGSLVMAKISSTICKISLKDKRIIVWDLQDTRHPKCGSAISISIILAFQCHHPIPPCYTIVFTIMEGEICHREVEIVNDLYFKELHVRNRAQNQRQKRVRISFLQLHLQQWKPEVRRQTL